MTETEIRSIISRQRAYFETGATLPLAARRQALAKLKAAILRNEEAINAALKADLGKSSDESYMCEIGMTLAEISHMQRHIGRYAKDKTVVTPLVQFASRSYVKASPYGVVLVMSPWNYPFMLSLEPLVDALAAGNTVILKPSAYSPATSEVLRRLLAECFDDRLVAVVTGGRAENQCLLQQNFDYIFFTGSPSVGREVMRAASANLTPVTLELGGKSPCIVDKTADLALAARRIVFGKYLNCGQTCVAPDYILCEGSVKDKFIAEVKKQIARQYGDDPMQNPDYGKIVNKKHFDRLLSLIDPAKMVYGGRVNAETLQIEPTVLDNVTWDDAVMQQEIFGPIMPVLTFSSLEEVVSTVQSHSKPLALYIFSSDRSAIRTVTETCSFGGGCVNDTIIHLATSNMGFGGVGGSGMGAYHGKVGFDTFSHKKSIVDKKTWMDLPMRYQPYTRLYQRLIRIFLH